MAQDAFVNHPHNFDQIWHRQNTHSYKWDFVHQNPDLAPVIPLWVADMDFTPPECVLEALAKRTQHPFFGYTQIPHSYKEHLALWHQNQYTRKMTADEIQFIPSVMRGISMLLRALTRENDAILNLTPVYGPFAAVVKRNQRTLIETTLNCTNHQWGIDYEALRTLIHHQKQIKQPIKALLFANPHNPTGRAWNKAELMQIALLCIENQIYLFADEIHGDLYHQGFVPCSYWDLLTEIPELSAYLLVFGSPTKSFNLAGLSLAHIFTSNTRLQKEVQRAVASDFFDGPNPLSLCAAQAVYHPKNQTHLWLKEMLAYVQQNQQILNTALGLWSQSLGLKSPIQSTPLEATYLSWVDVSSWIQTQNFNSEFTFIEWLEKEVRVKLGWGHLFRKGGENHLRFNLACPQAQLNEALDRIHQGICKSL